MHNFERYIYIHIPSKNITSRVYILQNCICENNVCTYMYYIFVFICIYIYMYYIFVFICVYIYTHIKLMHIEFVYLVEKEWVPCRLPTAAPKIEAGMPCYVHDGVVWGLRCDNWLTRNLVSTSLAKDPHGRTPNIEYDVCTDDVCTYRTITPFVVGKKRGQRSSRYI